LIAAYLGNIVGALLVAVPAWYFYLMDWRADGLEGVEEGEGLNGLNGRSPAGNSSLRSDDIAEKRHD
jgi:hypothetical protein